MLNKTAVVTGAASGIGRALSRAIAGAGARSLLALDLDLEGARETAKICAEAAGAPFDVQVERCDVGDGAQLREVLRARDAESPVDLFVANAGVAAGMTCDDDDAVWQRSWAINVMQTKWAAEALVPSMAARGGGAFLVTSSAAGLLTQLGAAPYTTTKHAAVGLAEWLAITYGAAGIEVCCLCPQGVRTPMVEAILASEAAGPLRALAVDGLLDADDVAAEALESLAAGRFLCMPGGEASAARHVDRKAADRERWIEGMRRLQQKL